MGTRGSVGFRYKQRDILFYNHSDSYPSYLGRNIVGYVRSVTDWEEIRNQVEVFEEITVGQIPNKEHIDKARELGTINLGVSYKSTNDWYCLTREAQGDIGLSLKLGFGKLDNEFPLDSLFCEYAYIINLDTMELEFYKGFNKDRNADGRYAHGQDGEDYAGIALVGEVPLSNIPEDWEERFFPEEE